MPIHDIVVYGTALIILIIAIISMAVYMRRMKGKNVANDFILGLSDQMVTIALDMIAKFNPADYDTIEEYETFILSNIYTKLWEFVSSTAREEMEHGNLINIAFQYIDSDTLVKIIDTLFTEQGIFQRVEDRYAEYNLENKQEVPTETYSEEEYFEDKEVSEEDLEPAEEKQPTEEEIAALNPPKEEEDETFDVEDDSMELIEDEASEFPKIIVQADKNGNNRYYEIYSDGKKKQVKKEYAESILNK